jgi:hypothetical protein
MSIARYPRDIEQAVLADRRSTYAAIIEQVQRAIAQQQPRKAA